MLKSNLRVSRYPYKDQGQTVALVRATTTKTVQFTLKSAVKIQRRLSKNATATVSTLVQVTSDTVKCFVLVRQDTQKCGQLTKKASHTLWNANYLPYTSASANPLLRSAKAVLYELRNKVTLQFNSDDFDRTEDFIRENFGEARYRNTTVTSIEALDPQRQTPLIQPLRELRDRPTAAALATTAVGCTLKLLLANLLPA